MTLVISLSFPPYKQACEAVQAEVAESVAFFRDVVRKDGRKSAWADDLDGLRAALTDEKARTRLAQQLIVLDTPPERECAACICKSHSNNEIYYCPAYNATICDVCCAFDADAPGGLRQDSDAPCLGCDRLDKHRWEWPTDKVRECVLCHKDIVYPGWATRTWLSDDLTDNNDYNNGEWSHTACGGMAGAGRWTGPNGEDLA